jgi:hypothetical protein
MMVWQEGSKATKRRPTDFLDADGPRNTQNTRKSSEGPTKHTDHTIGIPSQSATGKET